jgi:hypothetical protein
VPGRVRAERIAGLFCEMIAEDEDARTWLRDLEGMSPSRPAMSPAALPPTSSSTARAAPDRREPEEQRDALPDAAPPPDRPAAAAARSPTGGEPASVAAGVASEVGVGPSRPVAPEPTAPMPAGIVEDLEAALELAEEAQRQVESTRRELVDARRAVRRAQQQRDEARGSLGPPQSVAAALDRAHVLFADRLVVLESARRSAEDSPYRHPTRVFEVLAVLALFGRHDGELAESLARALGNAAEWKPKDSPSTTGAFGSARTWVDTTGGPKLFRRHVTLGGSVSATRCLQVYYDVLADGRLEIAWCGEHRPTVSEDT